MVQFSGKITHLDPKPYVDGQFGARYAEYEHGFDYRPRPEFDYKPSNPVNPILVAASESYDPNDPWGSALGWIDAIDNYTSGFGYEDHEDAEVWGASYERIQVWELAEGTGEWNLPRADEEHMEHAKRVFHRLADVARANGLDY